MSLWRFFRVGLALFLFFSLSTGAARASLRESASLAQDLWRVVLAFIPAATEGVSNAVSYDTTGDEGPGTEPVEEPGEDDDKGSEMDPNG